MRFEKVKTKKEIELLRELNQPVDGCEFDAMGNIISIDSPSQIVKSWALSKGLMQND